MRCNLAAQQHIAPLLSLKIFKTSSPIALFPRRCTGTTSQRISATAAAAELDVHRDILEVLFTQEQLQSRINEMGRLACL
jgi:hypothetical protein